MTATQVIVMLVIGLVAGWLASLVVGGGGGLVKYIVWGLLGSVVGGLLFPALGFQLNLASPILNAILVSAAGAIVLVLVARLIA